MTNVVTQIWVAVWNWMCGKKRAIQPATGGAQHPVSMIALKYREDIDPRELEKKDPYALKAAYLLGATKSEGALSTLLGRLTGQGAPSRNAMYGLIELGSDAVSKLIDIVANEKELEEVCVPRLRMLW